MVSMINITVYTSLDKGIKNIEVKAKELALLLSYYTSEKVDLNIIITPLSAPDITVPSVRIDDLLFNNFDISEIISKMIIEDAIYLMSSGNSINAASTV